MIHETQDVLAKLKGPQGEPGVPGVGIKKISQEGHDLVITLTDGSTTRIKDVQGPKGDTPNKHEIVSDVVPKVMEQIRVPQDGKSPDIKDIVNEVLNKIVIPEPKAGKDGTSPSLEEVEKHLLDKGLVAKIKAQIPPVEVDYTSIIQSVLSRIVIPTPKDGQDGKSVTVEEVVEALKKEGLPLKGEPGEPGVPGKDMPFSTWIKLYDIGGTTNAGSPTAILADIDLEKETTNGVQVTIIGKGSSGRTYFYGKKEALIVQGIDGGYRISEDVVVFNPRKSQPQLNFEVQPKTHGLQIVAIGLPTEEIIWKGEVQVATV